MSLIITEQGGGGGGDISLIPYSTSLPLLITSVMYPKVINCTQSPFMQTMFVSIHF